MRLKGLKGMSWDELVDFMRFSRHALALETTPHETAVARLAEENEEAGAALAVAYGFLENYGEHRTAWRAYFIYEKLAPENRRLVQLRDSLSWIRGLNDARNLSWPCGPVPDDREKWGGLANLLFIVAVEELSSGSTTDLIGAGAIKEFLVEGMERKRARCQ